MSGATGTAPSDRHDFRRELARALAREALFDPGVEAARNACAAHASLASAAITAAAYYDNPLTGTRALLACLRRLRELAAESVPSVARFIAVFEAGATPEGTPGFGHVLPAAAAALDEAARELGAGCDCTRGAPHLAAYVAHSAELRARLGALNTAGLAALVFADHGVDDDEAERLYLSFRLEPALREAQKARRAGLASFPFFGFRYAYEGARPPLLRFDTAALLRRVGLEPSEGPHPVDEEPRPSPEHGPELRASAGFVDIGRQVVVHGRDLHHECRSMSFVHFFAFSATGRDIGAVQARVLEQLWIISGYADARIWCNRVAGFMGSARVDPALSASAALAACNNERYGFRAMSAAFALQSAVPVDSAPRERWLRALLGSGEAPPGYARPVRGPDERIGAGLQILVDAGVRAGPALERAFWLRDRLKPALGLEMHVSAFWAAVALDFGFDSREYDAFMLLMYAPGYAAVHGDQLARPALSFLADQQTRFED